MQVVDRCDFHSGDVIDYRYTVRKLLGEGSYGAVYLVEDGRKNQYALKLLRLWEVPAEIRGGLEGRFDAEFQTGQIDCDNLVRSLGYGKVGGNPYIIMEFCPGGDLEPYLGKAQDKAPQICRDILIGLNALHTRGKVHRDLKPENVLFKKNGHAALTDFGISGDRNHRMTQLGFFGKPNQIFGTWAYMPPEQANRRRGGATVLPTTDIFSFGVVAYQLLTGVYPFGKLETHNDLAEYLKKGEQGAWDRATLSCVNGGKQWEKLIDGCLVPDFKERFQTVNDVLSYIPQTSGHKSAEPVIHLSSDFVPKKYTRGYLLRVLQGEEYDKVYNLTQMAMSGKRVLTLGRQTDNSIFVKSMHSTFLSRYHCTIETNKDFTEWIIRDGQWNSSTGIWNPSRNGTFINSRQIPERQVFYLKPGDIIAVGDITLRFENY